MPAEILSGNALAKQIRGELKGEVAEFVAATGVTPTLAAVLVGQDPASEVYVRNKRKDCELVGIASQLVELPTETTQAELLAVVDRLNNDAGVHGILVQLPLPKQIEETAVLEAVNPAKDVDAFHPDNVGRMMQGRPRFLPCTPSGCQQILLRHNVPIAGRHVVVVGRSDIVGKPVAAMLVQRGPGGDATVTICHSRTADLAAITRQADILIVAIGKANFITGEMIKPGATVVDVGINRTDAGLVGDVDFASAVDVAGRITPVPGGVGPLTRTMLLVNTLAAARELVNS